MSTSTSFIEQCFKSMAQAIDSDSLPENELLLQMEGILSTTPEVVHERGNGTTLLHLAALRRSPNVCKQLIEIDSNLVRSTNGMGWLPFHSSCHRCNTETAKYLHSLYPESINIPNNDGFYPLHCLLAYKHDDDITELTDFLVKHDKGALSVPTRSGGNLPLHLACRHHGLAVTKLVYDAYPIAINTGNTFETTPLDVAIHKQKVDVVLFLQIQLDYEREAQRQMEPDENGMHPVHRAVLDADVSVGTIKLMVAYQPNCVMEVNSRGSTPLHLACKVGHLDVVKYLIETYEGGLQICNSRGEFPLQIACRYGKCNIINYILEKSDHGVSSKNAEKRLPIQVLLFDADCDRDSLEFVEAVGRLLFAFPVNPADLIKEDDDD